jgi:hypothetical protein
VERDKREQRTTASKLRGADQRGGQERRLDERLMACAIVKQT